MSWLRHLLARSARRPLGPSLLVLGALLSFAAPVVAVGAGPQVELGAIDRGGTFRPGSHFPLGTSIAMRGAGFAPNEELALEGMPASWILKYPWLPDRTDDEGRIPPRAGVIFPAPPGPGVLIVRAGDTSARVPVTIVPKWFHRLETPSVRPGRRLAVTLLNFLWFDGRPGVVVLRLGDEDVCVQTDASGDVVSSVVVPPSMPPGSDFLTLSLGPECPQGPSLESYLTFVAYLFKVDPAAPFLDAPSATAAGAPFVAGGGGFEAGQDVTLSLDGVAVAKTTADGAGDYATTLTLPQDTPPGEHLLIATTLGRGAATAIELTTAATGAGGPPSQTPSASAFPPAAQGPPVAPTAQGTPVAPTVRGVRRRGASALSLTLAGTPGARATILVRTRAKVRLGRNGTARLVTLARAGTGKRGRVSLTLTRAGRALLRTREAVRVVVQVQVPGARPTRELVTLAGRPESTAASARGSGAR